MNGTCTAPLFGSPVPWGLGEGPKGQISLNLNYKVNLQRFFNQTLCVFSHMKDIKHIREDFHLGAWVLPRGGTWGFRGGLGSIFFFPKFKQICCVSYSHEWHMHRHHFLGPRPLGPWRGVKNLIF